MENLLTERQNEVMELVKEGYSSMEVADILCISYDCIKSHMSNIYKRLGARNKAHAVALHYIFRLT